MSFKEANEVCEDRPWWTNNKLLKGGRDMRRQITSLAIGLLISLSLPALAAGRSRTARTVSSSPVLDKSDSTKQAAFQAAMRKLWEDHITWTRVFIISAAADLPDKATATNRLLQNQVDI